MDFIPFTSSIFEHWNRLVLDSDEGWTFSLAGWLAMSTSVWNLANQSFAIQENGKLVAAMPLHFIPQEKRLSSGGWGFGGAVVARDVSTSDHRRLWSACFSHVTEIAASLGASHITVAISPLCQSSLQSPWGVNPLVELGYTDVSTLTRITDISVDELAIWKKLSKNARYEIKQARLAGYYVRKCSWSEMLGKYYSVHVETYSRTGVSPHPKTYFEGIANQPPEYHVLWVGFDRSNTPVAFHNDARFGITSFYHTGCSETKHLKSGINYLLLWEAMLGAKLDGCRWYETGEAFPQATEGKDKGLTDFKAKFGGELHRIFRGNMILAPAQLKISENTTPSAPWLGSVAVESSGKQLLVNWLKASRALVFFLIRKFAGFCQGKNRERA